MKNALIFIGLFMVAPFILNAQSSIKKRTLEAESVFEGKIVSQQSFWNSSRTKIFTSHLIQVTKSFKGSLAQTQEIVTHGGEIDGLTHYYFHGKDFAIGDEGVFFCKSYANSSNSTDNFVMIKGLEGFVQYTTNGYEHQAFDNLVLRQLS